MDKLQYDSFYKFIVSVGVLLIVAPILLLHFWISGSYDLTISQQEFDGLTTKAAELLTRKMEYVDIVCSVLPIIFLIAEVIGIILFIWGCYKWYSIQRYLDRMSELDVKEKDIRLQQMTPDEKIERMAEEAKEEASSQLPKKESTDDKIVKNLKIEQMCYENLRKGIGSDYKLHRNVKINKYEYDIVAYSRKDNVDIIYEIKCWERAVSESLLERTCAKMADAEIAYETYAHRNKRSVLVVVSNSEAIECMKKRGLEKTVKEKYCMDVEFIEESSLFPVEYYKCGHL